MVPEIKKVERGMSLIVSNKLVKKNHLWKNIITKFGTSSIDTKSNLFVKT